MGETLVVNLALQLYTVRNACDGNLERILEAVAQIGYRFVELAGYGGLSAEELKAHLSRLQIQAISSHISMEAIRRDFPGTVAEARLLGCQYITIPSAPQNVGNKEGDWRFFREELRFYASQFALSGIQLCYHNHAREFEPLESGRAPFEILFEREEPYALQFDVYWASFAGYRPEWVFEHAPAQCPMIHAKDMSAAPDKNDVAIGSGVLNWHEILESAKRKGVEWIIVEVDNPSGDPLDAARAGYEYCTKNFPQLIATR